MDIQVRYGMNWLNTGKGSVEPPGGRRDIIWAPHTDDPTLDYRDSDTVWVWIRDDLNVEISRELVAELLKGFLDNDKLEVEQ